MVHVVIIQCHHFYLLYCKAPRVVYKIKYMFQKLPKMFQNLPESFKPGLVRVHVVLQHGWVALAQAVNVEYSDQVV